MPELTDARLLAWLLRRPTFDERCATCACWEAFGDGWGACSKPGAPPHDDLFHCQGDAVCDVWEGRNGVETQ